MCCPGCEAVAQAIVDQGLTDYYRYRTEPARNPAELVPDALQEMALYNRPDIQRTFVSIKSENVRQASLILEGIVCAACIWLNERHVSALPGVLEFRVNYASHRAQVQWDDSQIQLSDILEAIASIGYIAHPFDPGRQEALFKKERSQSLRRIAVAGLGLMQVMMLAVALYAGDYSGMDEGLKHFMRWVSLLITTPVVLYSAQPFFRSAWRDLRRLQLGMDVPVSLAIGAAFLASAWATFTGAGEVYFDSVNMFTFFLLSGRFLEMQARHKAGLAADELVRILPAMATRLGEGDPVDVLVSDLMVGDRVQVKPGSTIPADGMVIEGNSSIDESLLTGESHPVRVTSGGSVVGGSINIESPLVVEVTRIGEDTVLAGIIRLLDRAQTEKPRIAQLADRIAAWFVAAILLLAVAVFAWWWQHDPDQAFWITLSVLVVTCPCALSLATPAALIAGTGALTRQGLLTTRAHAIDVLGQTTHMIFDKTGTLTHGKLELVNTRLLGTLTEPQCIKLASALEQSSEHPLARAFQQPGDAELQASEVEAITGQGVTGVVDGLRYRLGSPAFVGCDESVLSTSSVTLASQIVLADESGPLCVFTLADRLRDEAAAAIAQLRAQGIQIWLLSGDSNDTVQQVARQLSVDHAEGRLLPADKLDRLRQLQDTGAVVAMVGDGVNDAPVLAGAAVSIAMGGGTQLAQVSADMLLLSENLKHLSEGVRQSQRTRSIIRQNLFWAIVYNATALPLAAAGYIAPWMAALGMSMSSLVVVFNALRLSAKPVQAQAVTSRASDKHPAS